MKKRWCSRVVLGVCVLITGTIYGMQEFIQKVQDVIPYEQKTVIIPCSDGNYTLDKWKVFESITLHEHCLRYNKNFESINETIEVPLFDCVDVEKMDLFSKALDVSCQEYNRPDIFDTLFKTPHKIVTFKKHFKALTAAQKRKLIIATGQYDVNGLQQLHASTLIAKIVDAFFIAEIRNQINSFMERSAWFIHCLNNVIKSNLTASFFPTILWGEKINTILRHETGEMSLVPACLQDGALYDGSTTAMRKAIDNNAYIMFASKIDNGWEHCITSIDAFDESGSQNKKFLWAIHDGENRIEKTVIQHNAAILNGSFSKNGKYLATASNNDVFITKINHQEDGTCSFDTYLMEHDPCILTMCFNNQSTMLVISSYDKQRDKGKVTVRDISGNLIATLLDEDAAFSHELLFSPDDNRLLVLHDALVLEKSTATMWDMSDVNNIKVFAKSVRPTMDHFDRAIVSPSGKHWAITTKLGNIVRLLTSTDFYRKREITQLSGMVGEMNITMLFSADSGLLCALVPQREASSTLYLYVWSMVTDEILASIPSFMGGECGMGITSNGRELVLVADTHFANKRSLLYEEDNKILTTLWNLPSVYASSVLRRLYEARNNRVNIKLYEEEPAYKFLTSLPKKPCDVAAFVKKYLSWYDVDVINNEKDVLQLCQETYKNVACTLSNFSS